jgi:hypothetical protein
LRAGQISACPPRKLPSRPRSIAAIYRCTSPDPLPTRGSSRPRPQANLSPDLRCRSGRAPHPSSASPSSPAMPTKGWETKQIQEATSGSDCAGSRTSRSSLSAGQSTRPRIACFIYLLVNKRFPHLFIYSVLPMLSYSVRNLLGDLQCSPSRRKLAGRHGSPGSYARPTERQCSRPMHT